MTSSSSNPNRPKKAFTLLELIVVVVVLSVLAVIGVSTFTTVKNNSYDSAARTTLEALARDTIAIAAFNGGVITADDIASAAAELPGAYGDGVAAAAQWTVSQNQGDTVAVPGQIAWKLETDGSAIGLAAISESGNAVYVCGNGSTAFGRIQARSGAIDATPALPCSETNYTNPGTPTTAPVTTTTTAVVVDPDLLTATATAGNEFIVLNFNDINADAYDGACWEQGDPDKQFSGNSFWGSADPGVLALGIHGLTNDVLYECQVYGYVGPDTVNSNFVVAMPTGLGTFPITATGGDAQITTAYTEVAGTATYEARCWTAAMEALGNSVTADQPAPAASVLVPGLENSVLHTCDVVATLATGDQVFSLTDQATPNAVTVGVDDPGVPPGPQPVKSTPEVSCTAGGTSINMPEPLASPDTSAGPWDIASFFSSHASGTHNLYFVDPSNQHVLCVQDNGTTLNRIQELTLRSPDNSYEVLFQDAAGITFGSNPARQVPASTYTLYSVLYVADRGTGIVYMVDVKAHRAYEVATGFSGPTGVSYAACRDTSTGAFTTVSGSPECLYVSDSVGVYRVPLLTETDASGSLQPLSTTTKLLVVNGPALNPAHPKRTTAATSDGLYVLRSEAFAPSIEKHATYGGSVSSTSDTIYSPKGVAFIPAATTGTTDLVVVAANDGLFTYDPANPVSSLQMVATFGENPPLPEPQHVVGVVSLHYHGNWPYVYVGSNVENSIHRINVTNGDDTTVLTSAAAAPSAPGVAASRATPIVSSDTTWTAHVIWSEVDGGSPVTGRELEYSDDLGGTWTPVAGPVAGSGYDVSGLDLSIPYQFRVRLTNAIGTSDWGVSTNVYGVSVPTAPRLVSAVGGDGSATASWTAPAFDGGGTISEYRVYKSGNTNDAAPDCTWSGGPLSCTVSLSNGATTILTVKAVNARGLSTGAVSGSVGASAKGVYGWGYNYYYNLGGPTNSNKLTPTAATSSAGSSVSKVSASTFYGCQIISGTVSCFGDTSSVGLADTTGLPSGGVSDVATGFNATCYVVSGDVKCTGVSDVGQTGTALSGSGTFRLTPTTVYGLLAGKTVTDIDLEYQHACAVADGAAYCWGAGLGRLGSGDTADHNAPVAVFAGGAMAGTTVTKVAVGSDHSCAIADGNVYCWGFNTYGQLGDGTNINSPVPVPVDLGGRTATDISAGGSTTCAVADGRAYCWGYGLRGNLGAGIFSNMNSPVAVSTSGSLFNKTVTQISVGQLHVCAVAGGQASCWGEGDYGRLGNGAQTDVSVPVSVGFLGRRVSQVAAGFDFTLAIAP